MNNRQDGNVVRRAMIATKRQTLRMRRFRGSSTDVRRLREKIRAAQAALLSGTAVASAAAPAAEPAPVFDAHPVPSRLWALSADSREALERELANRFANWSIEIVGAAALFTARV